MWGEIVLNLNSSLSSSRSSFINCKSLLAFHSPWIFQFCFVIKESWTSSIIVVNFKCRENQFTHATGKGTLSFVRLKFNKLDQWNSQSIVSSTRGALAMKSSFVRRRSLIHSFTCWCCLQEIKSHVLYLIHITIFSAPDHDCLSVGHQLLLNAVRVVSLESSIVWRSFDKYFSKAKEEVEWVMFSLIF